MQGFSFFRSDYLHAAPFKMYHRLVSVRLSRLPFKMHSVSLRPSLLCINTGVQIELNFF